ncbi:hypothetical protein KIH87_09760 [Paraneptunicella aestuarii]|uniref:hypothetical protein n=1 Tax=Paraneptunicella aestuarii TaxID=2831148 RepID=UPI001E324E21|nr:hypothetical protein [Paraneptunicella aestuarii]UAA40597.1 hypothetical protein KIH87_09760 [Paraneptunicella aestuarii]
MNITFDSNVWRIISSPEKFPNEPSIEVFKAIRKAIEDSKITPFLCETVFTLEAIKRKERKRFFSAYKASINSSVEEGENGELKLSFSMGPDKTAHPGNNSYLEAHLTDAIEIGFQIIKLPRFAGIVNPDIEAYYYQHSDLNSYHDKVHKVCREIEQKGAGISHIKELGERFNPQWVTGIKQAPESEEGNIAKAIAEWADGDSVACHIAVGGDYFCTRDTAKKAGDKSILSEDNLTWLKQEYNFHTISPEGLASKC